MFGPVQGGSSRGVLFSGRGDVSGRGELQHTGRQQQLFADEEGAFGGTARLSSRAPAPDTTFAMGFAASAPGDAQPTAADLCTNRGGFGTTGLPSGNGLAYMASHPHSGHRQRAISENAPAMKDIYKLRTLTNRPVANTFAPDRTSSDHVTSLNVLQGARRKHQRGPDDPMDRFRVAMTTAQDIGFTIPAAHRAHEMQRSSSTPEVRTLPIEAHTQRLGMGRPARHGMTQSAETKYYQNMKSTLTEASMRLIL